MKAQFEAMFRQGGTTIQDGFTHGDDLSTGAEQGTLATPVSAPKQESENPLRRIGLSSPSRWR